jgi:hypothetical protein
MITKTANVNGGNNKRLFLPLREKDGRVEDSILNLHILPGFSLLSESKFKKQLQAGEPV